MTAAGDVVDPACGPPHPVVAPITSSPGDAWRRRRREHLVVLSTLALLLLVSVVAATGIGAVPISPTDVGRILVHQVIPSVVEPTTPAVHETIVLDVRLPRVLLAAVVGAGLSMVGVVLQALVRNPLADPHIIGVSAGASVGATVVIVTGINAFGIYSLSAAAFVGALAALVGVYVLAQQAGRLSPLRLILAGVAVSYLCTAATSYLIFRSESVGAARSVTFWLLGGLGAARWSYLVLPAVVVIGGFSVLVVQVRRLDAILIGDDTAANLGVDPSRLRTQLFVLSALVAGVLVAVAGGIGFVALMIPHVARLVVGSSHRRLLPTAVLGGAIFLVWADVIARTAIAPEELPIGIITAFCGAPFFLWLLRARDTRRRVV